jgi:hypothetical protein
MCLNCGCGEPDDRHDSSANITTADVRTAAEANGQSLEETLQNMEDAIALLRGGAAPASKKGRSPSA